MSTVRDRAHDELNNVVAQRAKCNKLYKTDNNSLHSEPIMQIVLFVINVENDTGYLLEINEFTGRI